MEPLRGKLIVVLLFDAFVCSSCSEFVKTRPGPSPESGAREARSCSEGEVNVAADITRVVADCVVLVTSLTSQYNVKQQSPARADKARAKVAAAA